MADRLRHYSSLLLWSCSLLGSLVVSGCQTPPNVHPLLPADVNNINQEHSDLAYPLGCGDVIDVSFLYDKDLDARLTVGPDGWVALHVVGSIKVAGLTTKDLAGLIKTRYVEQQGGSLENYSLRVGDTFEVKFLYDKELNEEVVVRPDGKISLQLVGELQAAGLSPRQLSLQIGVRYASVTKQSELPQVAVIMKDCNPIDVTVNVVESASQKIYVGGEVVGPRMMPLRGTLRALEAIILAGGTRDTATLRNVMLIRYNGTEIPSVYTMDLSKVLAGESSDVRLKPYDILYVTKQPIAEASQFMRQVYSILPVSAFFTFPYDLNPQSTDIHSVVLPDN